MGRRAFALSAIVAMGASVAIFASACPRRPVSQEQVADNDLCYVCHMDFSTEELAVRHARAGIGCDRCHGPSNDHMSNEDNVIPPDVIYERSDVNAACLECHVQLPAEHPEVRAGATARQQVCTDCHGRHRVETPRRRWDKKTRKLLPVE